MDELDATTAETKATYEEIKAYVWDKHHLKVSSLYISQVKRKCGLEVGQNYNLSKSENPKVPKCPPEKEALIMGALKHFQMIFDRYIHTNDGTKTRMICRWAIIRVLHYPDSYTSLSRYAFNLFFSSM